MAKQGGNLAVRKNATFFFKLDIDRDGAVEKSDFTLGAQRMARELGHAAGSPGEKRLLEALDRVWAAYWAPADTDGDGVVNLFEYLGALQAMSAADPSGFKTGADSVAELQFKALDNDDDGRISVREYVAYISSWGGARSEAEVAFALLDSDHDGAITKAEWTKHLWDYHTSEDASVVGNWIYAGH